MGVLVIRKNSLEPRGLFNNVTQRDLKEKRQASAEQLVLWSEVFCFPLISLKVIAVVVKALIFNRLSSYFILEMKHILHLHKTYFIPQHRRCNQYPLAPRERYTKGPQRFQNCTYHI